VAARDVAGLPFKRRELLIIGVQKFVGIRFHFSLCIDLNAINLNQFFRFSLKIEPVKISITRITSIIQTTTPPHVNALSNCRCSIRKQGPRPVARLLHVHRLPGIHAQPVHPATCRFRHCQGPSYYCHRLQRLYRRCPAHQPRARQP